MSTKITHGRICRKMETFKTATPVPTPDGPDILEPTITFNFYIGSVCSEEIISIEVAKKLYEDLSKILKE